MLGLTSAGTYGPVEGSPIKPPADTVGLSAAVVAFDPGSAYSDPLRLHQLQGGARSGGGSLLAVGWNDADGATLAVSLHDVGTCLLYTSDAADE